MKPLTITKYQRLVANAVDVFWDTRESQLSSRIKTDQGSRGSVTGGKQLDGFLNLLSTVAKDLGVPDSCIFIKGNCLPGFFRPTKDWDFLIITPKNQLVAVVEFKSQVGSFGNNFNNRTEEALGSAVDLWTAFRELSFPQAQQPWLGYVILVEQTPKSTGPVKIIEPHFKVRPEFHGTSYMDRYSLFCRKLMQERHYNSTALISSSGRGNYSCPHHDISIDTFVLAFMGFLQGRLNEFQ